MSNINMWSINGVILIFLFHFQQISSQQLPCENRKPEGHTSKKLEGDGGFRVNVFGPLASKNLYSPNEVYTIKIHGVKNRYSTQKFTDFLIVAESEKQAEMGQSGLITTGIFHLVDDSLTRYSDFCPDGVTSTSLRPKSEVSVVWTAPSALVASCITFKVVLVERPQFWFMDDGNLTKTFCPESAKKTTPMPATTTSTTKSPKKALREKENSSQNDECCACDEAKYQILFEGIWSKETHPKDFPENEWLLHFSDIIGASHSNKYEMWKEGEIASRGIEHVAEWGSTREMENELRSKAKHINTIIKSRGLWHPNVNGQTSATFRVDKLHNLVSIVSMVGPSPDWIVGVNNYDLCLKNCQWLPEASIDLYPIDAGTDSGVTYMSPNMPSNPKEKIKAIIPTQNDTESPFYDPKDRKSPYKMKPFAKLILRRHRIFPKECNETFEQSEHQITTFENTEEINRPECAVTEFTPWSDCSVSCGKGLRMRKRDYKLPVKAAMMNCDRQLIEKEMCLGSGPVCTEEPHSQIEEIDDSVCKVTNWSEWTPCSVTCGKGTRTRSRRFKNYMGRKKCRIELTQTQTCVAHDMVCHSEEISDDLNEEDRQCRLTHWSEWSPCSVTCGKGFRERIRYVLAPLSENDPPLPLNCASKPLTQRIPCISEIPDCAISPEDALGICKMDADPGPCRSFKTRYSYQHDTQSCTPFSYGGCKGNRNRFNSVQECMDVCSGLYPLEETTTFQIKQTNLTGVETQGGTNEITAELSKAPDPDPEEDEFEKETSSKANSMEVPQIEPINVEYVVPQRVDCVVSEWSDWSLCNVSCGVGHMTKSRVIHVEPANDGKKCPRRLKRRRICRMKPCENN